MTEKDITDILDKLKDGWPETISYGSGNDDGRYLNLNIETSDRTITWNRIRSELIESKLPGAELRDAMIDVMTGAAGWDDYLLLHHYARAEPKWLEMVLLTLWFSPPVVGAAIFCGYYQLPILVYGFVAILAMLLWLATILGWSWLTSSRDVDSRDSRKPDNKAMQNEHAIGRLHGGFTRACRVMAAVMPLERARMNTSTRRLAAIVLLTTNATPANRIFGGARHILYDRRGAVQWGWKGGIKHAGGRYRRW